MRRIAVHQLRILVALAIAIAVILPGSAHENRAAPDPAAATLSALGLSPIALADLCLTGDPEDGTVTICSECLLCKALVLPATTAPMRHVYAVSLTHGSMRADRHVGQPAASPPPARAPPASFFV